MFGSVKEEVSLFPGGCIDYALWCCNIFKFGGEEAVVTCLFTLVISSCCYDLMQLDAKCK